MGVLSITVGPEQSTEIAYCALDNLTIFSQFAGIRGIVAAVKWNAVEHIVRLFERHSTVLVDENHAPVAHPVADLLQLALAALAALVHPALDTGPMFPLERDKEIVDDGQSAIRNGQALRSGLAQPTGELSPAVAGLLEAAFASLRRSESSSALEILLQATRHSPAVAARIRSTPKYIAALGDVFYEADVETLTMALLVLEAALNTSTKKSTGTDTVTNADSLGVHGIDLSVLIKHLSQSSAPNAAAAALLLGLPSVWVHRPRSQSGVADIEIAQLAVSLFEDQCLDEGAEFAFRQSGGRYFV